MFTSYLCKLHQLDKGVFKLTTKFICSHVNESATSDAVFCCYTKWKFLSIASDESVEKNVNKNCELIELDRQVYIIFKAMNL